MTSKRIIISVFILALLAGVAFTVNSAAATSQAAAGASAKVGVGVNRGAENASVQAPGQAGKKPGVPTKYGSACKYGGFAGEPSQEKVTTPFSNSIDTYVYKRCGLVYSTYVSNGCGCRAGGWRYTTKCVKNAPVTIYLPCHRRITFFAQ
jgi:hypothetical protein